MKGKEQNSDEEKEDKTDELLLFIQFRGRVSEKFENVLRKLGAPCKVVFTLKKVKMLLPSLKPKVEKSLKSWLVYKISCSRCKSCYVGQTIRHLTTRCKEHSRPSTPVSSHMISCNYQPTIEDDVTIVANFTKSQKHLETLKALCINELKPGINTKDEYRSHTLVIKI